MMQDVFLFSGTLRDNIVLSGDYTDEQIERAGISVGADEMIKKLPKKHLSKAVLGARCQP